MAPKNITLSDAARAALARFAAAEQPNDSAAIAEALRRADLPPATRQQGRKNRQKTTRHALLCRA